MKIGVSSWYKNMDMFSETFKDYHIQHVQVGLPSDVSVIESDFYRTVNKFRICNPGIELSIHAYPFNLAERVREVRKANCSNSNILHFLTIGV